MYVRSFRVYMYGWYSTYYGKLALTANLGIGAPAIGPAIGLAIGLAISLAIGRAFSPALLWALRALFLFSHPSPRANIG